VLLVRTVDAGPGLEQRGLQTLRADGAVSVAFSDEWAVPPAEGVEAALRAWLAASGLFVAVLAPGSRQRADLILESELTVLVFDQGAKRARAALSFVLLNGAVSPTRVLTQATAAADAPVASDATAEQVAGQRLALAAAFEQITRTLAAYA
jgi:hypothetical protein